ncbi:MAG: MBL fold metallo-hydrolase [Solirubrobacteraceae bacterium]|jgi:glyoxylase-like metal-dependent hydrolase (beta-lactamase superfamily II)
MNGPDVRGFTVGPVQENTYIVRADAQAKRGVIVDPGEESERLLEAARELGVAIEAILITHCHFDHIGAVAPLARATGAPVYCPEIERPVLADVMSWVPPGFGPFESYEAEHTLAGGEQLSIAGLEIDVRFTPGHSPGHVSYAIAPGPAELAQGASQAVGEAGGGGAEGRQKALFSGDVLFQGSVGRVDLPGGDWATLERSIGSLLREFPAQTAVYPGHMGVTTLGRERDTNPFLKGLVGEDRRVGIPVRAPADAASGGT